VRRRHLFPYLRKLPVSTGGVPDEQGLQFQRASLIGSYLSITEYLSSKKSLLHFQLSLTCPVFEPFLFPGGQVTEPLERKQGICNCRQLHRLAQGYNFGSGACTKLIHRRLLVQQLKPLLTRYVTDANRPREANAEPGPPTELRSRRALSGSLRALRAQKPCILM
jgi:hypothetical protein